MDLRTACSTDGLKIDVVARENAATDLLQEVVAPSEQFLKIIEETVEAAGGWSAIERWYVGVAGDSFTSLRGHLTLVNTLAPMHAVEVWTFSAHPNEAEQSSLPILPEYHMEPNITTHKNVEETLA